MSFLANLFRGSTISREVPTVNYPAPGEVTPSLFPSGGPGTSIVTTEPAQPEATTRTISTHRPPPLLAFIADFLAGLSRQGAGPGIQARIQSQQADLDRQMESIDKERKLKEAEYERSRPLYQVDKKGNLTIIRKDLVEKGNLTGGIIQIKRNETVESFVEKLSKSEEQHNIKFEGEDKGRLWAAYEQDKRELEEERGTASNYQNVFNSILEKRSASRIKQEEFDAVFPRLQAARKSLGILRPELEADLVAGYSEAERTRDISPAQTALQSVSTSLRLERSAVEAEERFVSRQAGIERRAEVSAQRTKIDQDLKELDVEERDVRSNISQLGRKLLTGDVRRSARDDVQREIDTGRNRLAAIKQARERLQVERAGLTGKKTITPQAAPTSSPKVGDIIVRNGKRYRIKEIKGGNAVLVPVP